MEKFKICLVIPIFLLQLCPLLCYGESLPGWNLEPKKFYIKNEPFEIRCRSRDRMKLYHNLVQLTNDSNYELVELRNDDYYELKFRVEKASTFIAGSYMCQDSVNNNLKVETYAFFRTNTAKMNIPAILKEKFNSETFVRKSKVVFPCRTFDDRATMEIYEKQDRLIPQISYDPKIGVTILLDNMFSTSIVSIYCKSKFKKLTDIEDFMIFPIEPYNPNKKLILPNLYVVNDPAWPIRLVGTDIILECKTNSDQLSYHGFEWVVDKGISDKQDRIIIDSNDQELSKFTMTNLKVSDSGQIKCFNKHIDKGGKVKDVIFQSIELRVVAKDYVNPIYPKKRKVVFKVNTPMDFFVKIHTTYIIDHVEFFRNESPLDIPGLNARFEESENFLGYKLTWKSEMSQTFYRGTYTAKLYSQGEFVYTTKRITVSITTPPTVEIRQALNSKLSNFYNSHNSAGKRNRVLLKCNARGIPTPTVKWSFSKCEQNSCVNNHNRKYVDIYDTMNTPIEESTQKDIWVDAYESGFYKCDGINQVKTTSAVMNFFITDVPDNQLGYGLINNGNTFYETIGSSLTIHCFSHIMLYYRPQIYEVKDDKLVATVQNETLHSLIASMTIPKLTAKDDKAYYCSVLDYNNKLHKKQFDVNPFLPQPPTYLHQPDQQITMNAQSDKILDYEFTGNPLPTLVFYFNDSPINTSMPMYTITNVKNRVTLHLKNFSSEGILCARINNLGGFLDHNTTIVIQTNALPVTEKPPMNASVVTILVLGLIFLLLLIVLVFYIVWNKQHKKRHPIYAHEVDPLMMRNAEGVLNPDIPIFEQTDHIGYNEELEFPKERLQLGKVIGSGHYGIVYQGVATNIANIKGQVKVAIKQPKIKTDQEQKKSLISELKILIHIGRHLNILNLMGAITLKDNLNVIVVYCELGSLESYIRNTMQTSNYFDDDGPINMYGFNEDHSRRNCRDCIINENNCPIHCNGNVSPLATSSEQEPQTSAQPVTRRMLHIFAYQIARGMEYLSLRNFIHRDLAARNVLLTSERIVKICDFGLTRNLYSNTVYEKKSSMQLPLKWMAIECISHNTYTIKSDVWSFGVTMYEIYSLGCKPYSKNFEADRNVRQFITDGGRLEKPQYATDVIYCIMRQCWEKDAKDRPDFTQLRFGLGELLSSDEIQYFDDLDGDYKDITVDSDTVEPPPDYRVVQSNAEAAAAALHYRHSPNSASCSAVGAGEDEGEAGGEGDDDDVGRCRGSDVMAMQTLLNGRSAGKQSPRKLA